MSDKGALDLLGVKGLSESIRIATQGSIDAAAAFLSRLCLPAVEELGLALRDRVSEWRAKNAVEMLSRASRIYNSGDPRPLDRLSPRLVAVAFEEASWIDDKQIQAMWSGLLASSVSPDGKSDENLLFMNLLKQLSSLEIVMLSYGVEKSTKYVATHGLVVVNRRGMVITTRDLPTLFAEDLHRIDRELDHLHQLGLVGRGIDLQTGDADLTPSPLALHLYVRARGSRLSPAEYWELPPEGAGDQSRRPEGDP